MTTIATDDMLVQLRDGPQVSVKALRAMLALEARGVTVQIDTDGGLLLGPEAAVPVAWVPALRAMKSDLILIARYLERTLPSPEGEAA